jgi:hypothetical protein
VKRALGLALAALLPAFAGAACLQDVESGAGAWSMSGLWHVESAAACAGAHSGSRAFYFGIDGQCNYDNGQIKDGSLTSPPQFITGAGDTNFSFWTKWQVESVEPSCYDQLWIERYDASSSAWVHLADVGPAADPPSSGPDLGMASVTGLGGAPMWQFVQIDLSAFAGASLQLRFRFVSSACQAAACAGKTCGAPDADFDDFLGWVVDDISFGCPPAALSVQKSASLSYAARGQAFDYVLSAKNLDSATQTLSVWDTLPAGAIYAGANPAPSSVSGQLVSWIFPGLGSQAVQAMTVSVTVDPAAPYPSDWFNTASGASTGPGAGFTSQAAPVKIRAPGLTLAKSAHPSTLTSGDQVTFTISLGNFTAATIPRVDLNESYPGGFIELGAYPPYSGFRTWAVLGLLPGETRYFTVWGFANGFNGQSLTNRVEAFVGGVSQGSATASVSLLLPEVPQFSVRTVYPNPAPSGKAGLPQSAFIVYDSNQALDFTLDVFSVSGEKVRSLPFRALRGRGQVEWDLKNGSGVTVASGIYLARLWHDEPQIGLIEGWAHIAVLR